MTLHEQVEQAMRSIPRFVPTGQVVTVEWEGRPTSAMYAQAPDEREKDRLRAEAAIKVVQQHDRDLIEKKLGEWDQQDRVEALLAILGGEA